MMFYNCKSLKKLDFSHWDTYEVYHTNMPNFDEDGDVTPMPFASCNDMLKGCDRLVEVTFPETWNLPVNQCGLADNWETTGDVNYA